MSLDVSLVKKNPSVEEKGVGLFIKENEKIREITKEEWNEKFPGTEPILSNGDFEETRNCVFDSNITHNLNKMADAAGIYEALWRPEEIGATQAKQLIEPLTKGLIKLKENPKKYKLYDSSNGWGIYEHFVPFVEEYLNACIKYPECYIEISR